MALHAKTWKLARHGRIRTRSSDHPVPEPPHSRQADPRERSRSLGAPSKQAPRQSRLAIHNRKRPRQTQKAIPSIRVTRATRLLAPLCRIEPVSRPQRAFTSRLPADWSPALPLNMTTTWTGLLVLAGLSPAGMAASLAAPDPYLRLSRIRLLPRVSDGKRLAWPQM